MKLSKVLLETNYQLYHPTFISASQAAHDYAEKKGYEINDNEWFSSVSTGKKRGRPAVGKSNSFHVKLNKNGKEQRKQLHFQVYGMESGKYELNMYIQ